MERITPLLRKNAWQEIAQLGAFVPLPLTIEWLEVADTMGFALVQLRQTDAAVAVLEQAHALEPTRRRASAIAYAFYDALLEQKARPSKASGPQRNLDNDKKRFRHWIELALSADPPSIKDLYRLGMVEAQVESHRDKVALRLFVRVIEDYRKMPDEDRSRRGDLHKYYVKALYAGARSALRLSDLDRARAMIFECLRGDAATTHVEPVFELFLAGKVCFELSRSFGESGRSDESQLPKWAGHAERAFRKAIDAKGPPGRDFVYAKLAELALWLGKTDDAARWIEDHIPPHRRKSVVFRLLGEIRRAQSRPDEAMAAFKNALEKDRGGRHLTLSAIGELHLEKKEHKEAERAFRQAIEFRRRRYLSLHQEAMLGLIRALEARGKSDEAERLEQELESSRIKSGHFGPAGFVRKVAKEGRDERVSPKSAASAG